MLRDEEEPLVRGEVSFLAETRDKFRRGTYVLHSFLPTRLSIWDVALNLLSFRNLEHCG